MNITIPLVGAIIIITIINTIITHLINWLYREFDTDEEMILPFIVSMLRWVLLIGILLNIIP